MPDILRVLKEASVLPPGHDGIKVAKKVVEIEYSECRKIEKNFLKLWKGIKYCNIPGAQRLSNQLCQRLGVQRMPKIRLMDENNKFRKFAVGYQHGPEIYFRDEKPWVVTVIHETAHYIVWRERMQGAHNEDFLWVESALFSLMFSPGVWYEKTKNK